ncbi:Uncharacterised protein [Flavonifractor plautii]|uniref:Uncharacterized protein n=1 Tax=Flavonifractor plautii TaxID=292800 RepID=A0A174FPY1_FLAPL|nr:Uncharacterised protein [Flavonifractor plautii]
MQRNRVVFPAPLAPRTKTSSPGSTRRSTPRSTSRFP